MKSNIVSEKKTSLEIRMENHNSYRKSNLLEIPFFEIICLVFLYWYWHWNNDMISYLNWKEIVTKGRLIETNNMMILFRTKVNTKSIHSIN